MRKMLVIGLTVAMHCMLFSQTTILIDGEFNDWDEIDPIFIDDTGDGQNNGIDIKRVWAHNDQSYLYFRFELTKEINIQENNDLAIYIDFDDNINTGFKINGIGAEVRYFFGERFGVIQEGSSFEFVNFIPVGMLVAPSVSSSEFEISIAREINESGLILNASPKISFRLEDNSFNGDEAPNDLTGISFDIDPNNIANIPAPKIDKTSDAGFRLLSYNIENDQLFDSSRRSAFRRIFQAIQPDIIALQEVRDFNSAETKALIEEFLPGNTWYHKKHGFDIVTISKYPINFSQSVDGNAAFYLDIEGQEILLINCHLPCCENDSDRQTEVDIIMEYIRNLKEGTGDYNVESGTPIIIAGDMNFVGDSNQPYTFKTGDIFSNGFYGPDFAPDWDETDLLDANPYATNTYSNFTWINPNGSFFPGKLDWIFYTDSKLSLENTYALYTPGLTLNDLQEFSLEFGDVIFASDHLPVIADFDYSTVDVNDFVEIDVSIYPNPVSTILNIAGTDLQIKEISILASSGETIINSSTKELRNEINEIDVSELISGTYFVLIQTDQGRIIKPFLKVK